ncbi:MAG: UDP-N-acetylmuramate dehydrogenase [Bacteroidetes bacterium]|nr:MAG: UDP-N-acetylmuramate dehydrogenase [Bacteroidota bacterium]TAE63149.1 MAG: UDP-N-acetylmuramate dehydrogenase [Bacteroidota bacterium]TAF91526.1 MAG: UDP-N-acetylmuramate dehydrogenase [Bacteroidota bacterium]
MKIYSDFNLQPYNTFGIDVPAKTVAVCENESDITEFLSTYTKDILVLGGGSNILFVRPVDEPVLLMQYKGIQVVFETHKEVIVEVNAGESWHSFVSYCVQNNWGGLENLSLIPGTVGAAPMQNIGAYGVEVKDSIISVTAIEKVTLQKRVFTHQECAFGYRESIFKTSLRNQFVVLSVRFVLQKNAKVNTSYGAIASELSAQNIINPSLADVAAAVIRIRQSKLPNPSEIGNAGSFFKNPIVGGLQAADLIKTFPTISMYAQPNNQQKVPAAWLIEQCGWKGYRQGDAGVHEKHALVLVNYGQASGQQIFDISTRIINSVYEKFGIQLEREVNIY